MSNTPRNNFALLQYYLRERLWCQAAAHASDYAHMLSDYTFLLWKAFAYDMTGQAAEALREYKACEGKRGVHAAALMGLRLIYKRNNDKESVDQIDNRLLQEERAPNYSALMQAALILWHSGDGARARDWINKVMEAKDDCRDEYTSAKLVRGWIDLTSGRGAFVDKCAGMFEAVVRAESEDGLLDIDGVLGKVAVLDRKNQSWAAQEMLAKLQVAHPWFVPGIVVKAKQLLRSEDWDQASEHLNRILSKDPTNIEALIMTTLQLLVRDARVAAASRSLGELMKALAQREPRNGQLYMVCAQCFARLSGGSLQIVQLTTTMIEAAQQMQPQSTDILSEVAYQHVLRNDYRTAAQLYKNASNAGDGNTTPFLGLIKCAIHQKNYDEAQRQIQFLTDIQTPQQRNAELLALTASLLWKKNRDQAGALEKLDQAVDAHRSDVESQPVGVDLYIKLNPHFCLEVAREYIQHCRTEPPDGAAAGKADPYVEKTRGVLALLLRHVPGSIEAQLLNSKMAFVSGDVEGAGQMIANCIRQDQSNAEAFLLQAQICMYRGDQPAAAQSLEQALSLEFEVKDLPQFNLLKGTLLMQRQMYEEAHQALEHGVKVMEEQAKQQKESAAADAANTIPGLQSSSSMSSANANPSSASAAAVTGRRGIKSALSVQDHVSLYLNLATVQGRLKRAADAQATIDQAAAIFRDTAQNGRVVVAHAMLAARTDIDQALEILRSVREGSAYFTQAKMQMAHLYLTQRGNKRAFIKCYEELVAANQTFHTLSLLGDAYATVQEPEKAINAYQRASAKDMNSAEIAVKIGRTLVSTHDYHKALQYYRNAVSAENARASLRTDLACLLWRLGDHGKAIQAINDAPVMKRASSTQDDLASGIERVSLTLLMSKILKSAGDSQAAVEALIRTRVYQNAVLTKARGESPESLSQQRAVAAQVCLELAEHYLAQHNAEKAVGLYNEALRHDEANDKAMLALARLYMHRGDLDGCEMQCNALLRVRPECEEAVVMLADLMNRRNRYDDAAYHFHQLLDKKPDNYSAMVHYVQLLRRAGHLTDAPMVFERATKAMKPGAKVDPGFHYAKGLYHRYTGNSREALTEFNNGRTPRDGPWAQKCLVAMIEVYINPDNDNIWEDVEMPEKNDNLKNAERLCKEVRDEEKRGLLEAYVLVASKRKDSLDRAVQKFFEISQNAEQTQGQVRRENEAAAAQQEQQGELASENSVSPSAEGGKKSTQNHHVPALVGMAIALQILKQTAKARNHLKKMSEKTNFNSEEDDDYERGYLLLAAIHTESGKHDVAQELLKRALQANKSCGRAWEAMGLIYEREQSYKDASDCYEKAWQLCNEVDAGIGYKLAFNYLKARRFVQAIDTCQKVLEKHPNYPKIRKEVLERARTSFRP